MFVLDTNVVSELMRPRPEPAVEMWVSQHPLSDLYFTAIGEAELRYGVATMPMGARREALAAEIEGVVRDDLRDRVLPFDSQAARNYARIAAKRRAEGRPASHADCQIAAIASSRNAAIVTRTTRDFEGTGIEIVDPWTFEEEAQ